MKPVSIPVILPPDSAAFSASSIVSTNTSRICVKADVFLPWAMSNILFSAVSTTLSADCAESKLADVMSCEAFISFLRIDLSETILQ
jgi:hypothetical protein